jgi:hypothetical protein
LTSHTYDLFLCDRFNLTLSFFGGSCGPRRQQLAPRFEHRRLPPPAPRFIILRHQQKQRRGNLKEKGCGDASPRCSLKRLKSIDLRARRGGVPVLSRPYLIPNFWNVFERFREAGSPIRPADQVFLREGVSKKILDLYAHGCKITKEVAARAQQLISLVYTRSIAALTCPCVSFP